MFNPNRCALAGETKHEHRQAVAGLTRFVVSIAFFNLVSVGTRSVLIGDLEPIAMRPRKESAKRLADFIGRPCQMQSVYDRLKRT